MIAAFLCGLLIGAGIGWAGRGAYFFFHFLDHKSRRNADYRQP